MKLSEVAKRALSQGLQPPDPPPPPDVWKVQHRMARISGALGVAGALIALAVFLINSHKERFRLCADGACGGRSFRNVNPGISIAGRPITLAYKGLTDHLRRITPILGAWLVGRRPPLSYPITIHI